MIYAFIYGAILCFGLIIPLGIQNIFVFNQGAVQRHFLHAMPSVLTAFFCDSLLVIAAVLGVSVAVLAIPALKLAIFVIGFFFLSYMGWVTWNTRPKKLDEGSKPLSIKKQVFFATSVSILNPHALLDTIGVIGTNSLHFVAAEKFAYSFGCIVVSFLWFFGLSIAGHYTHRLDKTGSVIQVVNKISAIIIWLVALYILKNIFDSLY